MQDCWNRPIASAPDAWIDVMERSDMAHTRSTLSAYSHSRTCSSRWSGPTTMLQLDLNLVLQHLHACSGVQPLKLLGSTRLCLNLGSYNYLGFAASDKYCTPRVQDTIEEYGISTCAPRMDVGAWLTACQLLALCMLRCSSAVDDCMLKDQYNYQNKTACPVGPRRYHALAH
jgi:serine palmitoyltransferase